MTLNDFRVVFPDDVMTLHWWMHWFWITARFAGQLMNFPALIKITIITIFSSLRSNSSKSIATGDDDGNVHARQCSANNVSRSGNANASRDKGNTVDESNGIFDKASDPTGAGLQHAQQQCKPHSREFVIAERHVAANNATASEHYRGEGCWHSQEGQQNDVAIGEKQIRRQGGRRPTAAAQAKFDNAQHHRRGRSHRPTASGRHFQVQVFR